MEDLLYDRISDGMAYLDATSRGWVKHAIGALMAPGGDAYLAYAAAIGSPIRRLELIGEFGPMWATMNGFLPDRAGSFGPVVSQVDLDRAWRRRIVARVGR
jgi:hypothetical protein